MHPSGEVGRFQMDNISPPPGDWRRSLKQEMESIVAKATARIWGTRNAWSLSAFADGRDCSCECEVSLEIQGDAKNGYHLVQSPDGFFAADSHHETKEDALETAEELFGVCRHEWSEKPRPTTGSI